ncbi:Uncharacterised protein [Elizabethkingia meningoseptica]|nr:Uncharacterised protein [Elizabethkingia meningoseptica]
MNEILVPTRYSFFMIYNILVRNYELMGISTNCFSVKNLK